MDLRFTDEDNAFRQEVRAFIDHHLDPGTRAKLSEHRSLTRDEVVDWQRTLNRRGWATPSWPKEWGGPGFSPVQRYLFMDELHQAPAPEPLSFNVSMIGPVIATFGTPEQKSRLLPRIANLDDWWCQGFSESGAGSDLASLSTSAVREGDGDEGFYVVNGTKLWQGMAHHADWMFTLVRTDRNARKQAGITMLLIDLRQPGVEVRPIPTMDGRHEVNSVVLDNVRVPVANRVGQENRGWDITKFLLGNERIGIARIGMTRLILKRAGALALHAETSAGPLASDAAFRRRAAEIEIELKALEITQMRVIAEVDAHAGRPDPRSSILKIRGTQLRQAASELLMQAAGPRAMAVAGEFEAVDGADDAPTCASWSTSVAPVYLSLRAATIYGGSTEIQKNILARAVLGL